MFLVSWTRFRSEKPWMLGMWRARIIKRRRGWNCVVGPGGYFQEGYIVRGPTHRVWANQHTLCGARCANCNSITRQTCAQRISHNYATRSPLHGVQTTPSSYVLFLNSLSAHTAPPTHEVRQLSPIINRYNWELLVIIP